MTGLLLASAADSRSVTLETDFSSPPSVLGWTATGNTSLFQWDGTAGVLRATWDSRETNSYFALPLGTALTRSNDFCIVFDLRLDDVIPSINPDKNTFPFAVSVGLINLSSATASGFHRGAYGGCGNFLDFSYFPDIGGSWMWGASITTMGCDNTGFGWTSDGVAYVGLDVNTTYRVTLVHAASNSLLHTEILRDGAPFVTPSATVLPDSFNNVQLDHLAVCSYNDAGQTPGWEGSILAHGSIDNVYFSTTLPVRNVTAVRNDGTPCFRFESSTGWLYTLQRLGASEWESVSAALPGTGTSMQLIDSTPSAGRVIYRVRADRP
jgi:hypothetical protein